ncbi:MAG: type III polyketide synthase [Ferruginibacter sp.]|nr:type III polyketide synthase [Ferruginibacter sp.]
MSKIVSIATGVPPFKHQQADICSFADTIYCVNSTDTRKMKFLYRHSGITSRYSVIPDYSVKEADRQFYEKTIDLEPFPNLEKRMKCYADNAALISVNTIIKCIEGKIESSAITHLITVSCTGMSAPGLDLEIMEAMNLRRSIFRTSINFMGCYAAIHALKIGDAICKNSKDANVVIVCTELCTLHFQKENSIDNITSTLLFADGCAAVLVQHNETVNKGFTLKDFYSAVEFNGKKDMSWKLSSKGFLMTLSGYVPELVKEDFNALMENALLNASLLKDNVSHWCIHPGGKKILEAIQKSAGLTKADLQYSYDILNNYGNMSSPTVLFVLEKILEELQDNPPQNQATIFSAAFGPGLTMETFIATYD